MSTSKEIVQKWHDALNRGDVDRMVALVHQDVVVGGPRGKTSGIQVVRQWFGRANVRLVPLTYFGTGQTIVVEEKGEWIDPANGQVTGSQTVATLFTVEGNLITSIVRHDQVEAALSEAGLTLSDKA